MLIVTLLNTGSNVVNHKFYRAVYKSVFMILTIILTIGLAACSAGGSEVDEEVENADFATQVAEAVNATLAAHAPAEGTEEDEATEPPTPTSLPTETATPTITPTTAPSPTPEPTATPTLAPSVGVPVECGDFFTVTVLESPQFTQWLGEAPTGSFLMVKLELINNTGRTFEDLWEEDYQVEGTLDDRRLTFTSSWDASWNAYYGSGTSHFFTDDVPPSLSWKTVVAFDVNPDATNWQLIFKPGSWANRTSLCQVQISLQEEINSDG